MPANGAHGWSTWPTIPCRPSIEKEAAKMTSATKPYEDALMALVSHIGVDVVADGRRHLGPTGFRPGGQLPGTQRFARPARQRDGQGSAQDHRRKPRRDQQAAERGKEPVPAGNTAARTFREDADSIPRPHGKDRTRSEEHTSELQSRENLVCRLLLEKKKQSRQ